jgi:hypothetical protein
MRLDSLVIFKPAFIPMPDVKVRYAVSQPAHGCIGYLAHSELKDRLAEEPVHPSSHVKSIP